MIARRRRLRRRREAAGVALHRLLDRRNVRIRGMKLPCLLEQLINLPHFWRRQVRIAAQGLSDKGVGLHLVQKLLPLKRQGLHLFPGVGRRQGLVGNLELVSQLLGLDPKRGEFTRGASIFAEGVDRQDHFVFIGLRRQVHMDHDGAVLETRARPLVEHGHDSGSVRTDLIPCHIEVFHLRHAFKIRGDLFERLPFRGLDGHPRRIQPRVMVT